MRLGAKVVAAGALLLALGVLAACASAGSESSVQGSTTSASQQQGPLDQAYDLQAHRGGRDSRPENTLYSYQYALEQGATTIECDMQMTKDGVLVMSHEPVLDPAIASDSQGNRVAEGEHAISRMTLDEVRAFNVGRMDDSTEYYREHGTTQVMADVQVPTLRELFELVRDYGSDAVRMNIETKVFPDPAMGLFYEASADGDAMVKAFCDLVGEFGFQDRVSLQSFDWSTLVRAKELDPAIETVALCNEQESWGVPEGTTLWLDREEPSPWLAGVDIKDFGGDPVAAAHSLGIDDISPYFTEVTPEMVEEAHGLGMKVIPWTVNEMADMEALYRMGVDGIITDRVWTAREFLESQGENLLPRAEVDAPYHLEPDHL